MGQRAFRQVGNIVYIHRPQKKKPWRIQDRASIAAAIIWSVALGFMAAAYVSAFG